MTMRIEFVGFSRSQIIPSNTVGDLVRSQYVFTSERTRDVYNRQE